MNRSLMRRNIISRANAIPIKQDFDKLRHGRTTLEQRNGLVPDAVSDTQTPVKPSTTSEQQAADSRSSPT
jgi:hypothetical protein